MLFGYVLYCGVFLIVDGFPLLSLEVCACLDLLIAFLFVFLFVYAVVRFVLVFAVVFLACCVCCSSS